MSNPHEPTEAQLRKAFQASRLWALGWTFARAMGVERIRRSLANIVREWQRAAGGQHQERLL